MRLALIVALASLVACGPKQSGDSDTSGTTSAGGTTGEATQASTASPQTTTDPDVTGPGTTTSLTGGHPGPECPDPNSTRIDGVCYCTDGYAWCSPDDPDDLSCCTTSSTTSPTTGDTTIPPDTADPTGDPTCQSAPEGPCDPDHDNLACDDGPDCSIETSTLYACIDGMWQAKPEFGDSACKQLGHDFAFGCSSQVEGLVACGDGPGTACTPDDPKFCSDMTTLLDCKYARLIELDCDAACKNGAIDPMQHDGGYCMQSRISSSCTCCDDPDCP